MHPNTLSEARQRNATKCRTFRFAVRSRGFCRSQGGRTTDSRRRTRKVHTRRQVKHCLDVSRNLDALRSFSPIQHSKRAAPRQQPTNQAWCRSSLTTNREATPLQTAGWSRTSEGRTFAGKDRRSGGRIPSSRAKARIWRAALSISAVNMYSHTAKRYIEGTRHRARQRGQKHG